MDSRQVASSTKGSLEIQHNFNVSQVCCVFLSSRTRTLSWGWTAISWLLLPCLSLPLLITSGSNLLFGTLKVKVIVTQLCPTLCDHMDCSLPWFSVHGIFPARILEEVAIPFSGEIFPPQGLNPGLLPCRSLYWDQPEKSLWNSGKVTKAGVCSLQTRCSGVLQGLTVFQDHQFSSVTQSCPTLCDPMDCHTPGFPVHHQLLEFTQTPVHWVGDAIQPSHPLLSPSPPSRSWMLLNILQCKGQLTPHNKLLAPNVYSVVRRVYAPRFVTTKIWSDGH